jgi:hypothetical protein
MEELSHGAVVRVIPSDHAVKSSVVDSSGSSRIYIRTQGLMIMEVSMG